MRKKHSFLTFSDFEWFVSWFHLQFYSQPKKKRLGKIEIALSIRILELFYAYVRRSWSIKAKKTAQLCWNCTLCVERNSLVLKLFQKILKIMIFLQPLIQNFWQGCKSCLLRVERNKTDVFFRTWLLIPEVFFGTWAGVFDLCSEKKMQKFVETAPYPLRGTAQC